LGPYQRRPVLERTKVFRTQSELLLASSSVKAYITFQLIGHFLESADDLAKTWIVGSDNVTYTSLPGDIQVDELRNPDTDAGFYIVRQANSSATPKVSFELDLRVWNGNVTVPVTLNGRVGFLGDHV
jgi:hypothetical protein